MLVCFHTIHYTYLDVFRIPVQIAVFLHLTWVAFLWEIIMSIAEGRLLTWGLQGESVQVACLYRSRQEADQPHSDVLIPNLPGLLSLLHAYTH